MNQLPSAARALKECWTPSALHVQRFPAGMVNFTLERTVNRLC